ncbi:MAG: hypothetical protein RIS47_1351 [Bacteroidota bacterium]
MTHYFWPPVLNPGDTIGLVQPSGIISPERYADAQTKIQSLGYKIYKLPEAPRNWGYLGGTDEARIAELHHMYAQPEVRAIWCVRGGYGTQRILPMLDLDLIRRNPKALIGFSDITALGNYISQQTGQISFHGIMGVSQFSPYEKQSFQQAVGSNHNELIIRPLAQHTLETEAAYQPHTITAGSAQGRR